MPKLEAAILKPPKQKRSTKRVLQCRLKPGASYSAKFQNVLLLAFKQDDISAVFSNDTEADCPLDMLVFKDFLS